MKNHFFNKEMLTADKE